MTPIPIHPLVVLAVVAITALLALMTVHLVVLWFIVGHELRQARTVAWSPAINTPETAFASTIIGVSPPSRLPRSFSSKVRQ